MHLRKYFNCISISQMVEICKFSSTIEIIVRLVLRDLRTVRCGRSARVVIIY